MQKVNCEGGREYGQDGGGIRPKVLLFVLLYIRKRKSKKG